jgi:hypothetical protein
MAQCLHKYFRKVWKDIEVKTLPHCADLVLFLYVAENVLVFEEAINQKDIVAPREFVSFFILGLLSDQMLY